MQIVTFSFGSLLEGVMELNNLSRADIAKKLGISINNTYGTFALFKQNKGNLNKFIDYANAINKKVLFIFSKDNKIVKNPDWTAGLLLDFIISEEKIKTSDIQNKLGITNQSLNTRLRNLKKNQGKISTLIELAETIGYTVTIEFI